ELLAAQFGSPSGSARRAQRLSTRLPPCRAPVGHDLMGYPDLAGDLRGDDTHSNKSTARIRRCSIAAKSRCGRTRPRLLIDRTGSSLPVTCEEVVMHQFRTGPYSGSNVFHDPL